MEVERTFEQWSMGSPRVKWSAVIAGWAVGLAVQMLLILMGLGFGAWTIDLEAADPGRGIPTGAAVWTGLSMLVSAFTGGYVTARLSGSYVRSDGVYHGVVVWGVNWLMFAWLTTTAMSAMVGGVFSVFGTTLQSLGQGVSSAATTVASEIGERVDVSAGNVRREIESILQATGKPELQPEAVRRDTERITGALEEGKPVGEVSERSIRELRDKLAALDRGAAVNVLVNEFGLSELQAKEVVRSTIGMLGPLQERVRDVREQSAALGNEALDRLGTMALWLSVLALLTLMVSGFGGFLGTVDEALLEAQTRSESIRTDIRRAG